MELTAGLGLNDEELKRLGSALGTDCALVNLAPVDSLEGWGEMPVLLFVPWREWRSLDPGRREQLQRAENPPIVLLLSPDHHLTPVEVEDISSSGFLSVMAGIERDRVADALLKGREATAVMHDIVNMTREVGLERELLSRKNDQLEFLSRMLTRVSETLELPGILERTREELEGLLPVSGLCALFFTPRDNELIEAELYIPGTWPRAVKDSWVEYLLSGAARILGRPVCSYHLNLFRAGKLRSTAPIPGERMLLPLKAGPEPFGVFGLASSSLASLGMDTLQTLTAAVSHLSLALKNGVLFTSVKKLADHDGLTRIHNRQHFDKRLLVELKRHQRQGQSLSLLMLDLDRFKSINDTYGHQAGDLVLMEMGKLLTNTLRESDYPARYGGEEFVVILPHTTEEQAWKLAERIRRKLAAQQFEYQGRVFRVTTSIGIAGVTPSSLHPSGELVRLADRALYRAKAGGRNMVCRSAPPSQESSLAC
jgi:diguanylate cyclase (GGDEF)-like protein